MWWFFRLHEQNWDNVLLLIFALTLSLTGSVASNLSSDKRFHNVSKFFNEALSRTNLVFVVYFITLLTLKIGNSVGDKFLKALIGVSLCGWMVSFLVANHVINTRLKALHPCVAREDDSNVCAVTPASLQILWISKWNILIFGTLGLCAFLLATSKWACGQTCA